jgi:1-aminocyclopropane-1-carboxylate deaminase/D-cysteine desulfhydrase-like pyridoxal-dependent ACC family enzyme
MQGVVLKDFSLPTPVETFHAFGRRWYLKRDDRIHPDFSGNKARKFHAWLRRDLPGVSRLVSYGSAQSNALYSLSVLAKMRGWEMAYFVDHIPGMLARAPVGNYRRALENGVRFVVHPGRGEALERAAREYARSLGALFVEEGGRQPEAERGIALLAEEIRQWKAAEGLERLTLFLPSGTGTTAPYLRRHLPDEVRVLTTPCVGSADYLRRQFSLLEERPVSWPEILESERKYHFGRPYRVFYEIWLELREAGVEFELLYDPKGWLVLREIVSRIDGPILYLHQGGLLGNESMLPRYRRKFPDLAERERAIAKRRE